MPLNLSEIFEKDYLKGYFNRNKKIFLVSIILFIVLGSIGTLTNSDTMGLENPKNLAESVQSNDDSGSYEDMSFIGFLVLFVHNFINDFTCILGGLFFFIPSLHLTFINATNIITLFTKVDAILLLFGVIPHGIFEIPSSIFAMAGGLMLFLTEINVIKALISRNSVKEAIDNSNELIKDALISTAIVFVLLLIAAFVETFITPVLLNML